MLTFIEKQVAEGVFSPEEVRILVAAFDAAWHDLQSGDTPPSTDQIDNARNVIAGLIIKEAIGGERDEGRLAELALLGYVEFKNPTHIRDGQV